jgi:hypothetical protein
MASPRQTTERQIAGMLARYSPSIATLGRAVRRRMRQLLPGWAELVYDTYNGLAFGYTPTGRPSDAVFSIVLYPKWVRLFFLQNGAELSDPAGLLTGKGVRIRSLVVPSAAHLDEPAVRALMAEAQALAELPAAHARRPATAIKSITVKQRPRRPRT